MLQHDNARPMLQESVHNSWKLKTSQFLHGQHTYQICHPMSMFGMLWIDVYDSMFQFLPISSNFAKPLKRSGPTSHRPQSTTWSTLCEGDVLHCVRQMIVIPETDWFSEAEGLQPEWKQQDSSGAWCVWLPHSAFLMPKTAGQSSRQRRRRGLSATREHSGTVPSSAPSCQRDTARDAAPGPQAWTSHDPESVRSPSLLGTRGLSQHAAHVEPPGHDHPHAGLSGLWPGGPAVMPWHVGQKPPPHNLYKHCQLGLTNTYRPVREDTAHPAERRWLLDIAARPQTAPQRGCPCTPKWLRHRDWWGSRSHKICFGQWKVPSTIL